MGKECAQLVEDGEAVGVDVAPVVEGLVTQPLLILTNLIEFAFDLCPDYVRIGKFRNHP